MSFTRGAREVGISEVAPRGDSCAVIGLRGLLVSRESTKHPIYSLHTYACVGMMWGFLLMKYALVAAFTSLLRAVRAVVRLVARAQIILSVVKSIIVFMVVPFCIAFYLSVHIDFAKVPIVKKFFSHNVNRVSSLTFLRKPMMLHKAFVVFGIYDSIQAFSERNKFDILIKRLLNGVTLDVVFHSLSATEIVQRVTALNSLNYNELEAA